MRQNHKFCPAIKEALPVSCNIVVLSATNHVSRCVTGLFWGHTDYAKHKESTQKRRVSFIKSCTGKVFLSVLAMRTRAGLIFLAEGKIILIV
jgi:hypothetical protein